MNRPPGSIATTREACEQLAKDLRERGEDLRLEWSAEWTAKHWKFEKGRARVMGFDLTGWILPRELGFYLTGYTDAVSVREEE